MEGCGNFIGPYPCCSIITGDAKELAEAIPDESIDLIFTDPVYDRIEDYRWLAETGIRVLRPNSALLAFFAVGPLGQILSAFDIEGLRYKWLLGIRQAGPCLWYGDIGVKTRYCAWFEKGRRVASPRLVDVWFASYSPNDKYSKASSVGWAAGSVDWSKGDLGTIGAMRHWITGLSSPNELVLDTFAGFGNIPATCKMLGRHYLAFEIDPDVAERARERVRNTQPPLFVLEPEQMALPE